MGGLITTENLTNLLLTFPVFLISLVFHEYAHAWMGLRRGDDLAKHMGRLTLNPVPHIDPIGTLLLPIFFMLSGSGFMFGWAKPVPVNPRVSSRDLALIALAGPASNLLLIPLFFAIAFALGHTFGPDMNPTVHALYRMAGAGILWNVILAVFNMVPIPPLDGSKILYYFLPINLRAKYMSLSRYSFLFFLAIFFTPLKWAIFLPIGIILIVLNLMLPLDIW